MTVTVNDYSLAKNAEPSLISGLGSTIAIAIKRSHKPI
jgi:hypothetical protein